MLETIVVGTDGSDTAQEAVRQAAEMARRYGAKLHVVSAFAPVAVRVRGGDPPEAASWQTGPDVVAEDALNKAATDLHGVEVERHARSGDPAEALISVAEDEGADLIVLGNRGMSGARRFVLGSVPNKVSHHAPCSVFIVRTT